jgi:hypothetical protein
MDLLRRVGIAGTRITVPASCLAVSVSALPLHGRW